MLRQVEQRTTKKKKKKKKKKRENIGKKGKDNKTTVEGKSIKH